MPLQIDADSYSVKHETGEVSGPFLAPAIVMMLQDGGLNGNELVSADGENWLPIHSVSAFADHIEGDVGMSFAPMIGDEALPPAPVSRSSNSGVPDIDLSAGGMAYDEIAAGGMAYDEIADLPGLPPTNGPVSDLPGLPNHQSALSDLPGLPNNGPGVVDLPGLRNPSGGSSTLIMGGGSLSGPTIPDGSPPSLADLPAPKARKADGPLDLSDFDLNNASRTMMGMASPAAAGQPASPGIADLPQPGGITDLPAPAGITDLPAPVGVADLPVPVGVTDLPAPAGITDLPAPLDFADLPQPGGITDLPAPAGITDLPQPAAGADLPLDLLPDEPASFATPPTFSSMPPGFDGLPPAADSLPSLDGLTDLPPASGVASGPYADLPPPASLTELPRPTFDGETVGSDLPGGPAAGVNNPFDGPLELDGPLDLGDLPVSAPIIDDRPPVSTDDARPFTEANQPDRTTDAESAGDIKRFTEIDPADPAPVRGVTKSRKKALMIGGGVAALVLAGGVGLGFTHAGFFGVNLLSGEKTKAPIAAVDVSQSIPPARKALLKDTPAGFAAAAKVLATALKKSPNDVLAKALHGQVLVAQSVRFGLTKRLGKAKKLAKGLPVKAAETRKLRALLALSAGQAGSAAKALHTLSKSTPKDALAALYLGWARLQEGEAAKAEEAFKAALSAHPALPGALFGMARAAELKGESSTSLEWAQRALKADADHLDSALLVARLRAATGEVDDAEQRAKKLIKTKLPPKPMGEAHALLARLAEKKGEIDGAREHFRAAIKHNKTDMGAYVGLARMLMRAQKYGAAKKHLRAAQKLNKSDIKVALLAAEVELALGNPLNARTALEKILKKAPKSPWANYLLGRVEEAASSPQTAEKHYRAAIELDPKLFEPYLYLSRLYLAQKKTSLAMMTLKQADNISPDARFRNAMGEVHYASGKLSKARQSFEEALTMDDKNSGALFNLANTLRDMGQHDLAVERYEQLTKRDSEYPGLAENLGALYLQQKNYTEAEKAFDRALQVDNPSTALRLKSGRAYLLVHAFSKAAEQGRKTVRSDPKNHEARALQAEGLLGAGKTSDALIQLKQALEQHKSVDYQLLLARIYAARGRIPDATDTLAKALEEHPKRVDLRVERARLLIRSGTVRDGLAEVDRAIRQRPDMGKAHLYRGIALSDLGQEAKAKKAYVLAIRHDKSLTEAYVRLAKVEYDKTQWTQASQHAKTAIRLQREQAAAMSKNAKMATSTPYWLPEAHFLVAQTALKRNQRKEAIAAFKTYLKVARPNAAGRTDALRELYNLGVKIKK